MDTGTQWIGTNGQIANVRDFGATGDGTTNDSGAIQSALDNTYASAVYVPPGVYNIGSTTLLLKPGKTLCGADYTGSRILYSGTGDALRYDSGYRNGSGYALVNVRDLFIACSNQSNTGAGINVLSGGWSYVSIERVRITSDSGGTFKYGVVFDQAEISRLRDSIIENGLTTSGTVAGSINVWLTNGDEHTPGVTRSVTSLSRTGTLASATTSVAHGWLTGQRVTIANASPSGWNGVTQGITKTGDDTFTFEVSSSLGTPASGSITASDTMFRGFTNVIQVEGNQLNNAYYGIADDGGDNHLIKGNNFNGNVVPMRVSDASSIDVVGNTFETQVLTGTASLLFTNRSVVTGGSDPDKGCCKGGVVAGNSFAGTLAGSQSRTVSSLARSGTTVTATTTTAHGFSTGFQVSISGATPAAYNGPFEIAVTGSDTFTYQLPVGSNPSNASGSIAVSFVSMNLTFTVGNGDTSQFHEGLLVAGNNFFNVLGRSAAVNVAQLRWSEVGPNKDQASSTAFFFTGSHVQNGNVLTSPGGKTGSAVADNWRRAENFGCVETSWSPGTIVSGGNASVNVTIAGAVMGDLAQATFDQNIGGGAVMTSWVVAADTVHVQIYNSLASSSVQSAGTLRIDLWKRT